MNQNLIPNELDLENLRHMLGANGNRKSDYGTRNYFCASTLETDEDYKSLLRLCQMGYVNAGAKTGTGQSQYFNATVAGCELLGFSKSQIQKAMGR